MSKSFLELSKYIQSDGLRPFTREVVNVDGYLGVTTVHYSIVDLTTKGNTLVF